MVLGISLRGRKKKEEVPIPTSPSLPNVTAGGIPWPENLVDINDVRAAREHQKSPAPSSKSVGGGGVGSVLGNVVGFHRPFRASEGQGDKPSGPGRIASLFTSRGAQGFVRSQAGTGGQSRSQRRRVAPTLNIMVVGPTGTGKTSLLKLFLDTSDISPAATPEQRLSMQTFLSRSRKSTRQLTTACVEIAETKFDRVLMTLIDTPGLNYDEGSELGLERSVNGLVKYLDMQFDETMGEESKVIRQSKGDQHVHLCIYLIDSSSIKSSSARRPKLHPVSSRNKSQVTLSQHTHSTPNQDSSAHVDSDSDGDLSDGYEETHHHSNLSMNPAEIKVIQRLAKRVNVLPVIARTDGLTESRLKTVKRVVRRELEEAGIGFGVFSSSSKGAQSPTSTGTTPMNSPDTAAPRASMATTRADGETVNGHAEPEEEEERKPRTIIRIRPRKSFTGSERSRSRRRRSAMEGSPERSDEDQPPLPDGASQTNEGRYTRSALEAILPFGLVSPQNKRRKENLETSQTTSQGENGMLSPQEPEGGLQTPTSHRSSAPPSAFPGALAGSHGAHTYSTENDTREFPKGVFVRTYKWGTLDVLNPQHCDFVALRTAVLSTHFRALKVNTREVLYEKYRTERLLARRATRQLGEGERKRLLEDLGL